MNRLIDLEVQFREVIDALPGKQVLGGRYGLLTANQRLHILRARIVDGLGVGEVSTDK